MSREVEGLEGIQSRTQSTVLLSDVMEAIPVLVWCRLEIWCVVVVFLRFGTTSPTVGLNAVESPFYVYLIFYSL